MGKSLPYAKKMRIFDGTPPEVVFPIVAMFKAWVNGVFYILLNGRLG